MSLSFRMRYYQYSRARRVACLESIPPVGEQRYSPIPVPPISAEEQRLRAHRQREFADRGAQMVHEYPDGVPISRTGKLSKQWGGNPPGPGVWILVGLALLSFLSTWYFMNNNGGDILLILLCVLSCVSLFAFFAIAIAKSIFRQYRIIRAGYMRLYVKVDSRYIDSHRVFYHEIRSWAYDGVYLILDTRKVSLNIPVSQVDCTWIIAQLIYRDRYGVWASDYNDPRFTECLAVDSDWWMVLSSDEYARIRGFVLPTVFNNSIPNLLNNILIPSATNEFLLSP